MSDNTSSFAKILRNKRTELGLTQAKLGEMISYSEKSVSKWESGNSLPSAEVLIKLSRALGISIDAMLSNKIRPKYLLGIDGGGTKTVFCLTDLNENIIEKICLSSANPVDIGIDECEAVLEKGIREILKDIPKQAVSVFAGISGGNTGANRELLSNFLKKFGFVYYDNNSDTENAISVCLGEDDGIAVIVGTGCVICSQINGCRTKVGGYGYLFDMGFSAYDISLSALKAAIKEKNLGLPQTKLTALLEEEYGESLLNVSRFYTNGKTFISLFAKCVFDAAKQNDKQAIKIITDSINELALQISAALNAFPKENKVKVVLTGGLTNEKEFILPILKRALSQSNAEIEICSKQQYCGAVSIAKKLIAEE